MTVVSFLDYTHIYIVKSEMGIWIHSLPMKITGHSTITVIRRPSTKSDLLHSLELCEKQLLQAPNIDTIILDGSAVVHMLHPRTARTFQDTVFGSYILFQL